MGYIFKKRTSDNKVREFYDSYKGPKCCYNTFKSRVFGLKTPMEEAISPITFTNKEKYKTKYDITDEGRRCGRCKEWKTRDNFNSNKSTSFGKTSICRQCEKWYRDERDRKLRERRANKVNKTVVVIEKKPEAPQKYEPPCIQLPSEWNIPKIEEWEDPRYFKRNIKTNGI